MTAKQKRDSCFSVLIALLTSVWRRFEPACPCWHRLLLVFHIVRRVRCRRTRRSLPLKPQSRRPYQTFSDCR